MNYTIYRVRLTKVTGYAPFTWSRRRTVDIRADSWVEAVRLLKDTPANNGWGIDCYDLIYIPFEAIDD